MKFSTDGVAASGTFATSIAIDGVVPTNLVAVTAGGPHWLTDDTIIFGYTSGLGQLLVPSGPIVNLDALGGNDFGAGNSIYAAYLASGPSVGVRSNISGFAQMPLASLAAVDEGGRIVVFASQATSTGLQGFSAAGVQTMFLASSISGVRARSDVVVYQDLTTDAWALRRISTGALLPFGARTAVVTGMMPVVIGTTIYVCEYVADVGWSVRPATTSNGYLIPDTVDQLFNADAVWISGTTIRLGGCSGAGEAPTELRTFDINVATGGFRTGVTTSGALVWTTQTPLPVTALPASAVPGGSSLLSEGLYRQKVIDQNGLMTRPWYLALQQVARAAGGPVDLSNVTGVLDQDNGGTGTDTGMTNLLPSYMQFSDESLLLGRGEGNGGGDGQEISLGSGLSMTGAILSATAVPGVASGGTGVPGMDGDDGLTFVIPGPPGPTGATGATGSAIGVYGPPGFDGDDQELLIIPGPRGNTGATGSGGLIGQQVVTATGAGTYTPTGGTTSVVIELQGAGGGGGGCLSPLSTNVAFGRGGGGGGYIRHRLTAGFSGASYSVGAKGTGGSAGNNAGNAGGNTTFTETVGPTTFTAGGGPGGNGGGSSLPPLLSGAVTGGGSTTNGTIQRPGQPSLMAFALASGQVSSGGGGSSPFGSGGAQISAGGANSSAAGAVGTGYGSAGSGASASGSGAAVAGGDGTDGLLIIWEFA